MSYLGNNLETTNALGKRQPYNVLVGQDTFTVNGGYTPGLVSVFLNGALLVPGTDVDVSDGETIILSTPAITNGVMEVIDFGALALANVVQKSGDTMNGDYNMTGTLAMSSPFTLRNKLINGNFDYWQRATSQTSSSYGSVDRWHNEHSGSTKTVSRQSFTIGQTDVPNNPKYWLRTVVSSVAGANNFCDLFQAIEDVTQLSGKTVTLSFWAKADVNRNIAVDFGQRFGTGGSPSAPVNFGATTFALTTSWQKFTTTVTLPSVSGKTLGTNGNDQTSVLFWFDAGSTYDSRTNSLGQQSGTFDIAQVQLEEGSIATPFEVRPQQVELALCQRYFEKTYDINIVPGTVSSSGDLRILGNPNMIISYYFKVFKRSVPSVTYYSPVTGASGVLRDLTFNVDRAVNTLSSGQAGISFNNATVGSGTPTYAVQLTSDAEL